MGSRTSLVNKYPGICVDCDGQVPAYGGEAFKDGGKWKVRHAEGTCGVETDTVVETARSIFAPTSEQNEAGALFDLGQSMVIEAGAGTGKTSTLIYLATKMKSGQRGQYVAFNNAIVKEAATKFPTHVSCNTAHSLAYRAVGGEYKHKMDGNRQPSDVVAKMLHIGPISITIGKSERRTLAAGFLAGHVLKAVGNFCKSADMEIERRHFSYIDGIDVPTVDGRRTFVNNDDIASRLLPFAQRAWMDLMSKTGQLRFGHDHYLKIWHLSGPRINADVIFFDEAQDANPVMAAIVSAQDHAQIVYVGDSQQAIYEFTGAVNTLATLDSDHRVFLTQSFRFGTAVAGVANVVLERLEAELRLVGTDTIPSTIGLLENENAILCRTNATAVESVLDLLDQGRRPYLVGGGTEVVKFAKGARDLMNVGSTKHPELACFSSWNQVLEYVDLDAQGSDLRLMVKLIEKFGVETTLRALDSMASEKSADVIVSTAHKAKGREWDRVRLAGDFPTGEDDKEVSVQEMRLLYVAVTRARLQLDMSSVMYFFEKKDETEELPLVENDATRWVDGVE